MIDVKNLSVLQPIGSELEDITFHVEKGECVAVIGPNGAGKSLLLQAIVTPDIRHGGAVRLHHFQLTEENDKARLHLGYLANPATPEPYLTGFEYLELIGSFYHLAPKNRQRQIIKYAEALGSKEQLYGLLERYGAAWQQKVAIIATLLHQPSVLVWDEPTLHLDETGKQALAALITDHTAAQGSLLLATNDLAFAEQVADRIILLREGQLVFDGSLTHLARQLNTDTKSLPKLYHKLFHG